jgi:hypothetical protein
LDATSVSAAVAGWAVSVIWLPSVVKMCYSAAMSEFIEVDYDRFHATVGQMNVHPRCERDASYWETPYRELMGKTLPGYAERGPKRYFVKAALLGS